MLNVTEYFCAAEVLDKGNGKILTAYIYKDGNIEIVGDSNSVVWNNVKLDNEFQGFLACNWIKFMFTNNSDYEFIKEWLS